MPRYVLVVIGSDVSASHLAEASRELAAQLPCAGDGAAVWLAPGEAFEIGFEAPDRVAAHAIRAEAADRFVGHSIDVAVVPADNRRKNLLIADMDSTIIQQECIDEMADMLGLKPKIAAITERAMRGELDFEPALRERVGLLKGMPEADLQRVVDDRLELMPGARSLVATMTANSAFTALVSGGFTYFTSRIAARVGFDTNHANVLEVADGRLTGKVREPILGREAKLATLERYRRELGLDVSETLAVGDGANDLAMVKAAGLGVAYHAKPVVAAEAAAAIDHGDLTALLYLQGYRRAEFVEE